MVFGIPGIVSASSASDRLAVVMPSGGKTLTLSATYVGSEKSGEVAAQSVISCDISIDNPHKSTHNPRNANVVSHWRCSGIVQSLSLNTKLWRAGIQVGQGNSSNTGSFFLNGNAAATCLNGPYEGTAQGQVVFGPGYNPYSATANVASPVVQINNC